MPSTSASRKQVQRQRRKENNALASPPTRAEIVFTEQYMNREVRLSFFVKILNKISSSTVIKNVFYSQIVVGKSEFLFLVVKQVQDGQIKWNIFLWMELFLVILSKPALDFCFFQFALLCFINSL